ncbi:hypothetical protein [Cupriavidus necator]
MSLRTDLFQQLFGLRRNPFHHGAISMPGVDTAFYPDLYPGIAQQFAVAFLGAGKPPPIAFLWSLGTGEDARGFGKSTYLHWFAAEVNRDQGQRALALAGSPASGEVVLALNATFHTLGSVSLSHLLFDAVRSLVAGPQMPLAPLMGGGPTDRGALYAAGAKLITDTRQPWSCTLLHWLCHYTLNKVESLLADSVLFREWHKARLGRELFRTAVAFLRVLGVTRLVVLVDQVEDFVNWATPAYKRRRDLARLAELCAADAVVRGHVTFVLTMHPDSAHVAARHWPVEELGQISPSRQNCRVVVLREPSLTGVVGMVKTYLNYERVVCGGDQLRPFTEGAVHAVYAMCGGRPGYCIPLFSMLLETAADLRVPWIDGAAVYSWCRSDEPLWRPR